MRLQIQTFCLIILFLMCGAFYVEAQKKSPAYQNYIEKYSDLAIKHQEKYGIPASIKLAQAIMESGGGQSPLALKSNNHFGIKCHGWKGQKVSHDDDLNGECFRKYKTVEESYDDHSRFLAERSHYKSLFTLKKDDYKGWAKGLQKCGYATNKAYANTLIKLIEDYELHQYDKGKKVRKKESQKLDTPPATVGPQEPNGKPTSLDKIERKINHVYGLSFIYALDKDTYEQLASILKIKEKDLREYNDMPEDIPLRKGDIVYLEMKKKKADKPYYDHEVQAGESMHSISQKYAVQLKSLYKINKKKPDYVPKKGDVLKLR